MSCSYGDEDRRSHPGSGRSPGLASVAAAAILAVALTAGCNNPLDVQNPNDVVAEDLENAAAVPSLVNGALSAVARGVAGIGASYATAADEITWIGSRDAWNQLDQGNLGDPTNEFSDAEWDDMGTARFMTDRAVAQAAEFSGDVSASNTVRAFLYKAIVYTYIPNIYDDFVIPESPDEAASPIGESNMSQMYDTAIQAASNGLQQARSAGLRSRVTQLLAVRAWAAYSKAIWNKLNPPGSAPSDPLVNSSAAVQDARDVLDRVGAQVDWTYDFTYSSATVDNWISFQVNERGELQFESELVQVDPNDPRSVQSVTLKDPITGEVDPVAQRRINDFLGSSAFADLTVVSARLMNLIVAEAMLAQDDTDGFAEYINNVRAMDDLPEWSSESDVSAMEILRHELQVNKMLEVKRLADMYRFDEGNEEWLPNSPADSRPGTMFPIANAEILSNPNIGS